MRSCRLLHTGLLGALLLTGAACAGSRSDEPPPDERFGHRYAEEAPGDRETVLLRPPDANASYFYYPSPVDTVHIRPAPFTGSDAAVPVEVLVKGSLPDACSALHDVKQTRVGHIVNVTLEMRKPQGAVCAAVVRPYRFYLMLDGLFEPGPYTLKLNDKTLAFAIRAPDVDSDDAR